MYKRRISLVSGWSSAGQTKMSDFCRPCVTEGPSSPPAAPFPPYLCVGQGTHNAPSGATRNATIMGLAVEPADLPFRALLVVSPYPLVKDQLAGATDDVIISYGVGHNELDKMLGNTQKGYSSKATK